MTLAKKIWLFLVTICFSIFSLANHSSATLSEERNKFFLQDSEAESDQPDEINDYYDGFYDYVFSDATYESDDETFFYFYGVTTDDFDSVLFDCRFEMEPLFLRSEYEYNSPSGSRTTNREFFNFEVNEKGELDVLLEYRLYETGSVEQYQLSQYRDIKQMESLASYATMEKNRASSDVSPQSFFGLALAVVVALIIIYVVVAESAEQIRAKQNYTYNMALESYTDGVNLSNYIFDQTGNEKEGNAPANYHFGFTTFDKTGCEVAAVYNLLISLGMEKSLSEVIHDFEVWAIEFSVAWGNFGSNPKQISSVLSRYGLNFCRYSSIGTGLISPNRRYFHFKDRLSLYSSAHLIVAKWNEAPFSEGLHTFYLSMAESNKFYSYNFSSRFQPIEYASMDGIIQDDGYGFIVGYIINAPF